MCRNLVVNSFNYLYSEKPLWNDGTGNACADLHGPESYVSGQYKIWTADRGPRIVD